MPDRINRANRAEPVTLVRSPIIWKLESGRIVRVSSPANLLNLSSFLVVEEMRRGLSPTEACLAACRRIAENNVERRLQRADGRPDFNVSFYALNKAGEYGSASIYGPGRFAVAGAGGPARREPRAVLFPE